MLSYASLQETIDELAPDALWVTVTPVGDGVNEIGILDLDYRMTVWIATLSLDGRWTLSPHGGPWQGKPVFIDV
jgi:hypothetical protein